MNKNQIGRNSLIFSIVGLILVQVLISTGFLKNEYWHILLAAFEAATIGGFADWFAVSALFYEIPIPGIKKHTNIIVRNRNKLSEGIVDLVTNKWLSPEIIEEKISEIPITQTIVKLLKEPSNNERAINFLKEITRRLALNIDTPEVVSIFQSIIKEQINNVDLATPLGNWFKKSINNGDHNQLWDMLLDTVKKSMNENDTRDVLLVLVDKKIKEFKGEGLLKTVFLGIAKGTGVIDNNSIVDKLVNSINEFVAEAKGAPNHPVRIKFDQSMLDFSNKLIEGDTETIAIINDFQDRLVNNSNAENIVHKILVNFKLSIEKQLVDEDSAFNIFLNKKFDALLNELDTDKTTQHKIDAWIKNTIGELIGKYHHEIGEMVSLSLSKLNDFELVSQIEEKVGNDLQFIRLNGAVVGGFVGLIIALIRMVLL